MVCFDEDEKRGTEGNLGYDSTLVPGEFMPPWPSDPNPLSARIECGEGKNTDVTMPGVEVVNTLASSWDTQIIGAPGNRPTAIEPFAHPSSPGTVRAPEKAASDGVDSRVSNIYTTTRERVNTGGTGQDDPGWERGPQRLSG